MIVYHGSIITVDKPDVNHSYRPLDFGKGFYVTSVHEQAERWAKRKATLLGSDKAMINVYEMDENTDGLKVKSFYIPPTIRLFLLRRKLLKSFWYFSFFRRCKKL